MRIEIPSIFSEVRLSQYIGYHTAIDDTERVMAAASISRHQAEGLQARTVAVMLESFEAVLAHEDGELRRIIKIEGRDYGFIPSMDALTLKEHVDLTLTHELIFGEKKDWSKLALLMAILYRPVTERIRNKYRIEEYNGQVALERATLFTDMRMGDVIGAMLFFSTILTHFRPNIQESLAAMRREMVTAMREVLTSIESEPGTSD